MDPCRAGRGEPADNEDRIVRVHLLAPEVALSQADDAAVAEVDGGKHREG
jgi:hypothetical protein